MTILKRKAPDLNILPDGLKGDIIVDILNGSVVIELNEEDVVRTVRCFPVGL